MRGVDVLLAFPGIVFAILLITIIGSGIFSVAVAIASSTFQALPVWLARVC